MHFLQNVRLVLGLLIHSIPFHFIALHCIALRGLGDGLAMAREKREGGEAGEEGLHVDPIFSSHAAYE